MNITTENTTYGVCSRGASRPFPTAYGQRIKAEFTLPSGETAAIFENAGGPLAVVERGDKCLLLKGSKGYSFAHVSERSAAHIAPSVAPAVAPGPATEKERKTEIVKRIQEEVRRLAFCLQEVQKNDILNQLNEDGQRAAATTIFIHTSK